MREIDADEALVVQIEAPDLDWGFGYEELCDLGDELQEAIGEIGEVECADLGTDDSSLWCFGSNAEEMLTRAMPVLKGHPLAQRAIVSLQIGPDWKAKRSFRMGGG
ncbi:MAG TPA: hypothetical protein VNJ05_10125 [Sphingomicrobium sp.]|nr:hypothetical protein [Sphingomicrobium sp.]